jgi:hypothetical protein
MGIGRYQSGTRPPPDHPGRGRGAELYSECLSGIPNIQHSTSNFQHRKAGQSHPKRHQSHPKATPRPVDRHRIGTPKPPQGHPKATPRLPQGHPKATPRPPQGHPKATPRLPQGHPKATPRLPQGYPKATYEPSPRVRRRSWQRKCPEAARSASGRCCDQVILPATNSSRLFLLFP